MDKIYYNAGIRIRVLREEKKFTRELLAEKADISPKFLYEIEKGNKGFSAGTLYRLAKALETTADYILIGTSTDLFSKNTTKEGIIFNEKEINEIVNSLKHILVFLCKNVNNQ